jgi:mannose-1-phosphate guanylyltransferase / mannose-6-phosphate isomerase
MSSSKPIQVQPVVMAGGSGTRLWPLSRAAYPKQFLVLTADQKTLYQQAVARIEHLASDGFDVATPITVGNEEHRFMVLDQLRELGMTSGPVLLEPSARNTAPAMTLAALAAAEGDADPVLIVSPADHVVADMAAFTRAMNTAIHAAAQGAIVVLGITPDRPETGYGYIKCVHGSQAARVVSQFVEKPDLVTAERYLAEGNYTWNSGMFVLRASTWLDALKRFRPPPTPGRCARPINGSCAPAPPSSPLCRRSQSITR